MRASIDIENLPARGYLGLAGLAVLLGVAFAQAPLLPLAAAAGCAFFLICLQRPFWAFGAFVFAHIAVPIYVRLPPIGPLAPPPIALSMLTALAMATALAAAIGQAIPPRQGLARL